MTHDFWLGFLAGLTLGLAALALAGGLFLKRVLLALEAARGSADAKASQSHLGDLPRLAPPQASAEQHAKVADGATFRVRGFRGLFYEHVRLLDVVGGLLRVQVPEPAGLIGTVTREQVHPEDAERIVAMIKMHPGSAVELEWQPAPMCGQAPQPFDPFAAGDPDRPQGPPLLR